LTRRRRGPRRRGLCAVVKGFGWTWNTGGYEYPVFWGLVCIAIAIEEWKAYLAGRRQTVSVGGTPRLAA